MIVYDFTILFLNIFLILLFFCLSIITLGSTIVIFLVFIYPKITEFITAVFETATEIDKTNF